MYRMNQNRGMTSRQRCDFDTHNHMLNRRNACGLNCNAYERQNDSSEHHEHDGCGTYPVSDFNYSLAMVYSPHQEFQNLYCEEEGFIAGTIFKELDKPFYGPKCRGGACNE